MLWHLKNPDFPKVTSQSPEKNAGFKGGNRQTIQEFCFAEFLSFCTRLLIKQEFPDAKAPLSLKFSRFFKSEVSPALPKQKQDSSIKLRRTIATSVVYPYFPSVVFFLLSRYPESSRYFLLEIIRDINSWYML